MGTASLTSPLADFASYRFQLSSQRPLFRWGQFFKRMIDVLGALIGLLFISPLLLALALAVMLTSPGPVFYKSPRVGRNGQIFHMYKFRTMQNNAHALWAPMKESLGNRNELFKLKDDPRVTGLGRFLRCYSLDELPQLINVLQGDMSLVGPRPLVPEESEFEKPYSLRFELVPGMTGIWQVSGRSNLSLEQLCELELDYVLNWSLLKDLNILMRTIPAVLLKRGAY